MSGFTPFSAHDASSRRSPNGGAERPDPQAASFRHAVPFGSHPGEGRAADSSAWNRPLQRDPSVPLTGRVFAAALIGAAILGFAPQSAFAQESRTPAATDVQAKSDVVVTGKRPGSTCGGATSAQPIDYACLNSELKTAAAAAQPTPSAADAVTSQATTPSKVGTFSHTATAQRMGQNFGKSAQPYRPPAPIYSNPAAGRPPR